MGLDSEQDYFGLSDFNQPKEMNRWYFFSFDLGVSGGIWMSCLISAGYISKNKKREKKEGAWNEHFRS